jgi:hypothetical protein
MQFHSSILSETTVYIFTITEIFSLLHCIENNNATLPNQPRETDYLTIKKMLFKPHCSLQDANLERMCGLYSPKYNMLNWGITMLWDNKWCGVRSGPRGSFSIVHKSWNTIYTLNYHISFTKKPSECINDPQITSLKLCRPDQWRYRPTQKTNISESYAYH